MLEEYSDNTVPEEDSDETSREGSANDLIVVGVGASAGGLEAFKKLLIAAPPDSGMAFVLVQHLDPDHESMMADLLTRYTAMPVVQVEDGMSIEANHVYIIPPNTYMTIGKGTLRLSRPTERRGMRMAIDFFLRSLAEDRRERAICIILSGTGSDGSLGLKAVKERGGMVMVQTPESAQYDGMPRSAIATGLADYVLPIDEIPTTLLAYIRHFYALGVDVPPRTIDGNLPEFLDAALALVRLQTNHDFRFYKSSTLVRRIERRMSLHQLSSSREYLRLLQQSEEEIFALFKDLLISVTNFFRDPAAFSELVEHALRPLVRDHPQDQPLRVWVPGCATGEEAYSLAIVLLELLAEERKHSMLQIFATDIDEAALEVARSGSYPETIAVDVSPERLQRFFTYENQQYKVTKPLRDAVVFAVQNITSDPPFSRIDLISCRNLMIYLEPNVQQRIITIFHFALNERGVLFLGNAETVGHQQSLFVPVVKKWRIYRRLPGIQRYVANVERVRGESIGRTRSGPISSSLRRSSLSGLVQQQLLNRFAPVSLLVNHRYDILYIHNPFGNDQPFLLLPSGEPSLSLFTLLRDDLRAPVRTAILRLQRESAPFELTVSLNDSQQPILAQIKAERFPSVGDDEIILLSLLVQPPAPPTLPADAPPPGTSHVLRQLEHELAMTREDLQSTIEELETSNEELKAANEEVMSMNEELQSTNEELETSKEELQSLNEELITVNSQLQDKVTELEAASNDLLNLLSSTAIATLFLDNTFCIKRFTPATTQLFNLIPGDVGRPISDIVQKFRDDKLLDDARQVLSNLHSSSSEIQAAGERWFIRRILPYRTLDNHIDGVVITFTEVSELKKIESALRLSELRFSTALARSPITVFQQNRDLRYTWIHNPVGYTAADVIGKSDVDLTPDPVELEPLLDLKRRVINSGTGLRSEVPLTINGVTNFFDLNIEPLHTISGDVVGITCAATNITTRKQAEAERVELLAQAQQARVEAERAVDLRDTFLTIASHELKTPLTVLLGNTQVLQRRLSTDSELSERNQRALGVIVRNALRLNQLINLLLDVSRIERGHLSLTKRPFDLGELLRRIVTDSQTERSRHTIYLDMPAIRLPINADDLRLEQVFHNLIDNAVKYMPDGGDIHIEAAAANGQIYVIVSDSGLGIPADEQERIFEQFARSRNAEVRKISGMGIGLYVARYIIQSHAGTITVQSEEGQGSTFTVCLPAQELPEEN